jgi:hypothetical protein
MTGVTLPGIFPEADSGNPFEAAVPFSVEPS